MSLKEKLDALDTRIGAEASEESLAIRQKLVGELLTDEQIERACGVGDCVPAFTLSASDGAPVSSADLLRKGPLVATFYRGIWCPYCRRDLMAIEESTQDIRSAGVSVVAISQRTANSSSLGNLSFPILDDVNGDVAVAFGIRWSPADVQALEAEFGSEVIRFLGGFSWILPMQARYVVGQDGVITYANVVFDYATRAEPSEIHSVLAEMTARSIT